MIDSAALEETPGGMVRNNYVHREDDRSGEIYLELIIALTDTRTAVGSARSAACDLRYRLDLRSNCSTNY